MRTTPNFDSLAKPYRWLEYLTFGPLLQRTRINFLSRLASCQSALVLGDGDGRFTACLLRANPGIRIHAVDASPRMLEALQKSAGTNANRVVTEEVDLRSWFPANGESYDLIATHFFLDCLTTSEIAGLVLRLNPAVAPNAVWVVSDFHVPHSWFGRLFAAPLIAFLYKAFRFMTGLRLDSLPDHAQALSAHGWRLDAERVYLRNLLISQLWQRNTATDQASERPSSTLS